ncbi:unnamed protein product [Protopolystoma xenopodis]|uniref:Uncharacterized protein n=1 Tax=Protopolystoma xenopodis TaxID=117903 RepID=A0A448WR82_9PLAT|nr:unnamed protein product [Protopolystoma xenopodis]
MYVCVCVRLQLHVSVGRKRGVHLYSSVEVLSLCKKLAHAPATGCHWIEHQHANCLSPPTQLPILSPPLTRVLQPTFGRSVGRSLSRIGGQLNATDIPTDTYNLPHSPSASSLLSESVCPINLPSFIFVPIKPRMRVHSYTRREPEANVCWTLPRASWRDVIVFIRSTCLQPSGWLVAGLGWHLKHSRTTWTPEEEMSSQRSLADRACTFWKKFHYL